MDGGSLHEPTKSMDWDAVFSGICTPHPPVSQSIEPDGGFRKSGGSSTGSVDSMSDEAISERASMWGSGVATMVLKNTSESTPRCSNASLTDSAISSFSKEIPKVPKSIENILSSFRLASMVCDAIDLDDGLASIMYASAGFMHMTGYTLEEIVGRDCMFLRGDDTDAREIARVRAALKKGDVYMGRLLSYKKDKTPFWNVCTLYPIRGDQGKVIKYVGLQAELNDYPPAGDIRKRGTKSRVSVDEQPSRSDRCNSIPRSIQRSISEISSVFTSRSNKSRHGVEEGLPVFAIPAPQKAVKNDLQKGSALGISPSLETGTNPLGSKDSRTTAPARDGNNYSLRIGRTTSVDSHLNPPGRESKGYSLTIQRKPAIESSGDSASIPPGERHNSNLDRRSLVEPEARPNADETRPSGSRSLMSLLAAERSAEVSELKARRHSLDPRKTNASGKSDGNAAEKSERRASSVMRLFGSFRQSDRKSCNEWQEAATPSGRFNLESGGSNLREAPASDIPGRKLDGRDRSRHYSMRYFSTSRAPSLDLLKAAAKSTSSRHSVSDLRTSAPPRGRSSYYEPSASSERVLDRSQFCVVHG